MKKIAILLSCFLIHISAFCQTEIPNSSFENWSNKLIIETIDEWNSSQEFYLAEGLVTNKVIIVGNAQDGSNAVRLETAEFDQDTVPSYIAINIENDELQGFPYQDTVDTFEGYYKYDLINKDSASILVYLSKNGIKYSQTLHKFSGSESSWTKFSVPLVFGEIQAPDSVFIGLISGNIDDEDYSDPNSWVEFDNISFTFTKGTTSPSAIPNYSFEKTKKTESEQPDNWTSFDPNVFILYGKHYVTKSTDAANGNFSIQLETIPENEEFGPIPYVNNGVLDYFSEEYISGVQYIAQPSELTGKYKFIPSGMIEDAFITAQFYDDAFNATIFEVFTFESNADWTSFSIPLTHVNKPESIIISFSSGNEIGNVLKLDDLKFTGGDLGVNTTQFNKNSIYPNPGNENIFISTKHVNKVEVFNLSGQLIYKSELTNKNETLKINTNSWPNGIYLFSSHKLNDIVNQKIIIQH